MEVRPLWTTRLIRLGQDPGDDARTRRGKSMSVLVISFVGFATFLFSLDPARPPLFRLLDYTAIAGEAASIYMLYRTRKTRALFFTVAPVILPVQFLFLLFNGNAEGDILAFLMVPVAAVAILGPQRSWPWFWASLVPLFVASFADTMLPDWTTPLAITADNPTGALFHRAGQRRLEAPEGLAMIVGEVCLYLLTFSVYTQLQGASDVIAAQKEELEREHARSERLLASMLPAATARRLKEAPGETISDDLAEVTILFADIVGFTALADTRPAPEVVELLNALFTRFDALAERHGLEKIKTIGDAYMVAGGAPEPRPDHAEAVARMALDMRAAVAEPAAERGAGLDLRIGIATGPAVAGVIGRQKPFYDIWGDSVNMASRMESTGAAGLIQISESTRARLGPTFRVVPRGRVEVKGKGETETFLLEGENETR